MESELKLIRYQTSFKYVAISPYITPHLSTFFHSLLLLHFQFLKHFDNVRTYSHHKNPCNSQHKVYQTTRYIYYRCSVYFEKMYNIILFMTLQL